MNELNNLITPLTRGIIWFPKEEIAEDSFYERIDYLLDGLLTANLNESPSLTSRLIIGQNFNHPFYVMIVNKIVEKEIDSFVTLIKKDLVQENDITVIDNMGQLSAIRSSLKEIHNHLRSI